MREADRETDGEKEAGGRKGQRMWKMVKSKERAIYMGNRELSVLLVFCS